MNDLKTTIKLTELTIASKHLLAVIEHERPGGAKSEQLRRAVREVEKALVRASQPEKQQGIF